MTFSPSSLLSPFPFPSTTGSRICLPLVPEVPLKRAEHLLSSHGHRNPVLIHLFFTKNWTLSRFPFLLSMKSFATFSGCSHISENPQAFSSSPLQHSLTNYVNLYSLFSFLPLPDFVLSLFLSFLDHASQFRPAGMKQGVFCMSYHLFPFSPCNQTDCSVVFPKERGKKE